MCRISYGKLTNSPTIQHFQHPLMETTPFLGMRRSNMTVVYCTWLTLGCVIVCLLWLYQNTPVHQARLVHALFTDVDIKEGEREERGNSLVILA